MLLSGSASCGEGEQTTLCLELNEWRTLWQFAGYYKSTTNWYYAVGLGVQTLELKATPQRVHV